MENNVPGLLTHTETEIAKKTVSTLLKTGSLNSSKI